MTQFSFSQSREQAEKEYGLESGGSLKIKEGANKIRLMSPTIGHSSLYNGEKRFKYVCWVFDYADNKIKLYFMPATIHKAIENLQLSDDYAFTEVPMPYDITVNAKNAGTKEVDYQVVAARSNSPVPEAAAEQLSRKGDIAEVVAKLKEKEGGEKTTPSEEYVPAPNVSSDEISLADIPF